MDSLEPESADTWDLLQRARAGDQQAFEELFARFRPLLQRFVARRLDARLRRRLDASDIVQETQLEAYTRLADYLARRPMPFGLWLRKTAYQRLLKARRRHGRAGVRTVSREVRLPERSSLFLARSLVAGSTPSDRLARKEVARRVRQALARLPELDRQVIELRNFDGLNNNEVGCILGLEAATVSQRHGRALIRLRKLLVEAGLGGSKP
jgi:RNA polymerase sigma-70 factor (ECF subfamily)